MNLKKNGFHEYKLLETQNLFRENVSGDVSKGFNCATCFARNFCMKGCNACYAKFFGRRDLVHPMYCRLTVVEVEVGLLVASELGLLGRKVSNFSQQMCRRR